MFFFVITYGNKLTKKLAAWSEKKADGDSLFLGLTVLLVLTSSALAERIGINAVLGAFLVGLAFSNCEPHKMHDSLRKVVMSVFSPLYFVSVGLGVNLIKNFDITLVLIVLVIATIGKVGGVWLGAKISKLSTEGFIGGWIWNECQRSSGNYSRYFRLSSKNNRRESLRGSSCDGDGD